jgi:biotin operon repressor
MQNTKRPLKTRKKILAAVPGTPADIADKLDMDRKTIVMQMLRLETAGYLDKHDGGYYTLPGLPDDRPKPRAKKLTVEPEPAPEAAPVVMERTEAQLQRDLECKRDYVGLGDPCPACQQPSSAYKHSPEWTPMPHRGWFVRWYICENRECSETMIMNPNDFNRDVHPNCAECAESMKREMHVRNRLAREEKAAPVTVVQQEPVFEIDLPKPEPYRRVGIFKIRI